MKNEPLLKFEPETMEALLARVPAALERCWKLSECTPENTPGKQRVHVFDFEDGIRLIASREDWEDGEPVRLHVSASCEPGSKVFKEIECRPPDQRLSRFAIHAAAVMSVLFPDRAGVGMECNVTPKGVLHWWWFTEAPQHFAA